MPTAAHDNQIALADVGYLENGIGRRPFQNLDDDIYASSLETLCCAACHFLPCRYAMPYAPITPWISQIPGHRLKRMNDDHLSAITQG